MEENKMFRENIFNFMKEGKKTLFIPKNGGLNDYVRNMLPSIGVDASVLEAVLKDDKRSTYSQETRSVGDLFITLARGEDIPQRVKDSTEDGGTAYGLTGDDLFDEFMFDWNEMGPDPLLNLVVLNTYDWFDPAAEYRRPALCLMNKTGKWEDVPLDAKIAVNTKYAKQSERFLYEKASPRGVKFRLTSYAGDTEGTVADNINDCCIEIVYGGSSRIDNGLEVVEIVRFSDIALIGATVPSNPWEVEFGRIAARYEDPTDSYTSRLVRDPNEIVKKFGQEGAEFIQAYTTQENLVGEALDVFYSTMLGLANRGIKWKEIEGGLQQRWLQS